MGYNVNIAFMGGLGELPHCSVLDKKNRTLFDVEKHALRCI